MEAYAAIVTWFAASLGLFAVLALPVYCAAQAPSGPFWKGLLWGGGLGALPGVLVTLQGGVAGPRPWGRWWWPWGAGRCGARTWAWRWPGCSRRRFRARWARRRAPPSAWAWPCCWGSDCPGGADTALPSRRTVGSEDVVQLAVLVLAGSTLVMALGGMVGAQVQLWRSGELPRYSPVRRLGRGLAAVVLLAIVLPVVFTLLQAVQFRLEAPRRAREAQAREMAHDFPGSNQPLRDLYSRDPGRRTGAARQLGDSSPLGPRDTRAIPALVKATRDRDPAVRASAAQSLGSLRLYYVMQQQSTPDAPRTDDKRVVDALARLLKDPDPRVRLAAVTALGQVLSPRVLGLLQEASSDSDPQVASTAKALSSRQFGRAPRR